MKVGLKYSQESAAKRDMMESFRIVYIIKCIVSARNKKKIIMKL